jgi:hypothetical protein
MPFWLWACCWARLLAGGRCRDRPAPRPPGLPAQVVGAGANAEAKAGGAAANSSNAGTRSRPRSASSSPWSCSSPSSRLRATARRPQPRQPRRPRPPPALSTSWWAALRWLLPGGLSSPQLRNAWGAGCSRELPASAPPPRQGAAAPLWAGALTSYPPPPLPARRWSCATWPRSAPMASCSWTCSPTTTATWIAATCSSAWCPAWSSWRRHSRRSCRPRRCCRCGRGGAAPDALAGRACRAGARACLLGAGGEVGVVVRRGFSCVCVWEGGQLVAACGLSKGSAEPAQRHPQCMRMQRALPLRCSMQSSLLAESTRAPCLLESTRRRPGLASTLLLRH